MPTFQRTEEKSCFFAIFISFFKKKGHSITSGAGLLAIGVRAVVWGHCSGTVHGEVSRRQGREGHMELPLKWKWGTAEKWGHLKRRTSLASLHSLHVRPGWRQVKNSQNVVKVSGLKREEGRKQEKKEEKTEEAESISKVKVVYII